MIDGRAGKDHDDTGTTEWWDKYTTQVQEAADQHR